jgi:hypothetical protein
MSLIACCLYLSAGMAYMLPHPSDPMGYWLRDINQIVNPYGTLEIGWHKDFGQFALEMAARHASSMPAADFGQNTLEFRVRFYPFLAAR